MGEFSILEKIVVWLGYHVPDWLGEWWLRKKAVGMDFDRWNTFSVGEILRRISEEKGKKK